MELDFQEELDFQSDPAEVTTAQDLQGKYSGQVNEMTQQKPQPKESSIIGEIRGGFKEGASTTIKANLDLAGRAAVPDKQLMGMEDLPQELQVNGDLGEFQKPFEDAKSFQERAQVLSAARQKDIDEAYGDSSRNSWVALTSKFIAGIVTDPYSAIFPMGNGVKAAGVAGGILAASTTASEDLSKGKSIDPTNLAIETIVGASGGVVLQGSAHLLGPAVKEVLGTFMNKGSKVTADALQQEMKARGLKDADIGQLDLNSMASKLNSEFRLNGATPEKVLEKRKIDNSTGITAEDMDIVNHDFYTAKAENFEPVSYNLPKGPETKQVTTVTPGSPATKATIDKEWNFVPAKDAVPEVTTTKDVTIPTYEGGYGDLGVGKKGKSGYKPAIEAPAYFNGDLTLGSKVDYSQIIDNIDNYTFTKKNRPSVETVVEGTQVKTVIVPKQNKQGKVSYQTEKVTFEPNADALDKVFADSLAAKQERFDLLKSAVPVGSPTYNKVAAEALEAQGGLSAKGYAYTGDQHGLVIGAIENKEIPWTGEIADTFSPSLGEKPMDFSNPNPSTVKKWLIRYHEVADMVINSPWRGWEATGQYGKAASKMYSDSVTNLHARLGDAMTSYDKALEKFKIEPGSPQEQMAADVLRGILKPSDVSSDTLQFAQFMHKTFADQLNEAHSVGLISKEVKESLLKKGVNKGYFPRVWNNDFLDTNAGKALWEERLGGHGFISKQAAQDAYAAITHSAKETSAPITVTKNGDKYFIPMEAIKKAWLDRGVAHASMRSSHLEAKRAFPEELESLLKPFFEQDVKAVFGKYMKDVGTQVEFSKVFGGKDSTGKWNRDLHAITLNEEISKVSPEIGKQFLESYWQGVGDYSQSRNLQTFLNANENVRNATGKLNALETWHMGLSQITNLAQTTNSLVKVASNIGLTNKDIVTVYAKGVMNAIKTIGNKDAQREIDKFGATIDHVMVDTFSGLNGARNTVAGGEIKGVLSPLNYLSNPEKFLKATGFMATESWNRRVGHTFGVAYAEQLLERKMAMLKTPSRIDPQKMKAVDKALEELGISSKLDPSKVSRSVIDRAGHITNSEVDRMLGMAGQRFSNSTNFVNTGHTMPQFSGSFMGRMMYKYKSYMLHQSQFTIDNVIKPLTSGSLENRIRGLRAAAVMMGVGTPVGMSLDSFKRWIMSDDKEYTMTEKVLRGIGMVGGLTIMYDAAQQAAQSTLGLAGWVAGPMASDVSKVAYGASQSVSQGSITPLLKQAAGISPFTRALAKKYLNEKDQFNASFETKEQKFDESFK